MKRYLDLDVDSRLWFRIDWWNVVLVVALSIVGLLGVFSATYRFDEPLSPLFIKQAVGVVLGCCCYLIFFCINRKALVWWGSMLYLVTIGLLLFTLVRGSVGMGAQRWISLGFFKFQPSELAKLFFPAIFTRLLALDRTSELRRQQLVWCFAFLALSVVCIIKQPDLGTALIVLFSGIVLLWAAGLGKRFFISSFLICLLAAPVAWRSLKPYQKQRVMVFLGSGNKKKERYQIEQSRIAVGSGGMWGKGYLAGTQSRLKFLPENHTDFIFAVLCEEFGFVGAMSILTMFLLLFLRALWRIRLLADRSLQLLALGILLPTIFSAFINMAMVLGLMPIVGIPLPFITYGLTHLFIDFASMGWYNNIVARGPWIT